ncbi:hypothetical protein BGX30_001836 [Mortierella sp. GBA39]|nr:hypothetical protein BGX30_001836 [Mortierella sp. GBA39]
MQALTPLLFSMLFHRFGTKNTADMTPDAEGNYPIESLLGGRNSTSNSSYRNSTSSELLASSFSFGEGYPVDNNHNNNRSAKARRHHSTGTLLDSAQSSSSSTNPMNNNIRRNNTVPQVRRASRPERLSIDHAAFIATYPSLDGLGDMGYRSSSSMDYYRNNNNTADTANNSSPSPRRKASSSKLRKQQSQETLPASRTSTSSIASMVSDASSSTSCSSSASSLHEPLTPTKSSNYHSIDGIDAVSSTKKSSKRASMPVSIVRSNNKNTLINIESFAAVDEQEEENRVKSLAVCQSPQSDNFFSTEEGFAGSAANNSTASSEGVVKARGQRQLIAH